MDGRTAERNRKLFNVLQDNCKVNLPFSNSTHCCLVLFPRAVEAISAKHWDTYAKGSLMRQKDKLSIDIKQ